MKEKQRISLKDIAEACGVSRNTVSLALRNSPRLKAFTRERIQKKAEEMGYVVDPELGKLMTRLRERDKTEVQAEVAYVHTIRPRDGILPHAYYVEGAEAFLSSQGYRVRPYCLHPEVGMSEKELRRILVARGVEGILVGPMRPGLERVELPWEQFSGVAWGRSLNHPTLPQIDNDSYFAMQLCYAKLRERGCQRIGAVIPGVYDELIRRVFRSSFLGCSSLEPKSRRVEILDFNIKKNRDLNREEMDLWRKRYHVDGVIALYSDVRNMQDQGYTFPGDFELACLDLHQPVLGVNGVLINNKQVGRAAGEQLLFAIQHGVRGARANGSLTLIPGEWVEGAP